MSSDIAAADAAHFSRTRTAAAEMAAAGRAAAARKDSDRAQRRLRKDRADMLKRWSHTDGGLIPASAVKAADKLQDELVRRIIGAALPLSEQVARFRQASFDEVDIFVQLLDQEYGAKRGGSKGNLTLTTYDGLFKVMVAVNETIDFGPELQTAKSIVDECLVEWSADSRDEIRTPITRAFDTDSQGRINRIGLLSLLRLDFPDARWQEAMRAIKDSIRTVGSKRYIRMYQRAHAQGRWEAITIDVAAA